MTTDSAPAATVSPDSEDEPHILDDDDSWSGGGGDGGSYIELYASQRKFVHKAWWIPGDKEKEYEYRVDPDCRLMCRLRSAAEMGTKSGEGAFEDRYYDGLHTVRDGIVIDDAVQFIYENNSYTPPRDAMANLTAETEWHEVPLHASSWPELWYTAIKLHVGEYEARRGIRKELERLKRGLRIFTEQTSHSFRVEHDEKFKFSEFKPIDESTSPSTSKAMLGDALERSGLTLDDAMGVHWRIPSLATLLGDAKEGHDGPSKTPA